MGVVAPAKRSVPINKKIKESKIVLPGSNLSHKIAKKDQLLTPSMISRMRSAYKFIKDDTADLFKNEIFGVAQSISLDSMSSSNTGKPSNMPYNSALTIDLSEIINAKANINFPTFKEFAVYLYSYILSRGKYFRRCDVACDRYFEGSLKEGVRHDRGSGTKIYFDENSKFPASFSQDFLRYSENKKQLNMFLAQKFIKLHEHKLQIFVVTFKETILANRLDYMNDTSINYCTAEEADPRLLLHALHQSSTGLKNIMIKTADCASFNNCIL